MGIIYQVMKQQPKTGTPAAAITDLTVTSLATGKVRIEWTAPAKSAKYLILYADKPIVDNYSQDGSVANLWAGEVVPQDLKPEAGKRQSLEFDAPSGKKIYVAIATLTGDMDLSGPSNAPSVTVK